MKILNIPIEPLEERYSIQWDLWFKTYFQGISADVTTIYGSTNSNKIQNGSFLDVVDTNIYKMEQAIQIINYLSNVDTEEKVTIFFHDVWFPQLANIAYVIDGLGLKNVNICGCLHAGSYDEQDFLNKKGMSRWARYSEKSWFHGIVDHIFVATNFHKDLIIEKLSITGDKIHVTGFPIYFTDHITNAITPKENIIVFPHRLDAEKQPDLFKDLKEVLEDRLPDWKCIISKEVCETKEEYFALLSRSKIAVSFALQETWGIAMQEALFYNCIPIVPNRLSYTEMYPEGCLYEDLTDCVEMIIRASDEPSLPLSIQMAKNELLMSGENAIPNMYKYF